MSQLTFVVAGQSNGVSSTNGRIPKVYSTTKRVRIKHSFLNCDSPPVLETIDAIPVAEVPASGQCGPIDGSASWVFLGDMISQALNCDVKFVNISAGGTTTVDWVNNYLGLLTSTVQTYQPNAILWIQGESEKNLTPAPTPADCMARMRQIIAAARVGNPRVPFFVALDGYCTDNGWATTLNNCEGMPICAAQREMIIERLAFLGADIDALRYAPVRNYYFQGLPGDHMPGAEFEGPGLIAHAQAWFNILMPYLATL